jgi:hypothetical protein
MPRSLEPPANETELAELVRATRPIDTGRPRAELVRRKRQLVVLDRAKLAAFPALVSIYSTILLTMTVGVVGVVIGLALLATAIVVAAVTDDQSTRASELTRLQDYLDETPAEQAANASRSNAKAFKVRSYRSGLYLMRECYIGEHVWYERELLDPQADAAMAQTARWISAGAERMHELRAGVVNAPVNDHGKATPLGQRLEQIDELLEVGNLAFEIERDERAIEEANDSLTLSRSSELLARAALTVDVKQ